MIVRVLVWFIAAFLGLLCVLSYLSFVSIREFTCSRYTKTCTYTVTGLRSSHEEFKVYMMDIKKVIVDDIYHSGRRSRRYSEYRVVLQTIHGEIYPFTSYTENYPKMLGTHIQLDAFFRDSRQQTFVYIENNRVLAAVLCTLTASGALFLLLCTPYLPVVTLEDIYSKG
jgi:hypothetical protein